MANEERIRLWVDKLRSGEYGQGEKMLRTPDGKYCCLGVACDIYRKESGDGEWIEGVAEEDTIRKAWFGADAASGEIDRAWSSMPTRVYEWFGLPNADPLVRAEHPARKDSLSSLNDGGATFEEIAELIEHEWLSS